MKPRSSSRVEKRESGQPPAIGNYHRRSAAARGLLDLVRNISGKFGVNISSGPAPNSLERHLRDYLQIMNVNVVLDVGAFTGVYAKKLRDIGYKGKIISFEPVRATFDHLCETMHGDTQWSGHALGLSDEDREATINIYRNADFNSLLQLKKEAESSYGLDPSFRSQATIELRRLDQILPKLIEGIEVPRIFLKVDTQGHDMAVVRGATGVLDRLIGFQTEMPAVRIYEGMVSMAAALEYYEVLGFVPIGFYPVSIFPDIQITPEFDVLLNRFDGRLGGRAR
jgi:FkbM family methyltransferase